jgi:hypothetical protein
MLHLILAISSIIAEPFFEKENIFIQMKNIIMGQVLLKRQKAIYWLYGFTALAKGAVMM